MIELKDDWSFDEEHESDPPEPLKEYMERAVEVRIKKEVPDKVLAKIEELQDDLWLELIKLREEYNLTENEIAINTRIETH